MIRRDLAWALSAVIPHAGSVPEKMDWVGLERHSGALYAFTCNRYSMAAARIPDGPDVAVCLPLGEATELMRFVRPGRVITETQELVHALQPLEFHVGWDEIGDNRGIVAADSAVFETHPDMRLRATALFDSIATIRQSPVEWDELIFKPGLFEKFSKAARGEFDRVRIQPRRHRDNRGAAVVTVGADFIGAVAGMTYDQLGPDIIAELLGKEQAA